MGMLAEDLDESGMDQGLRSDRSVRAKRFELVRGQIKLTSLIGLNSVTRLHTVPQAAI